MPGSKGWSRPGIDEMINEDIKTAVSERYAEIAKSADKPIRITLQNAR